MKDKLFRIIDANLNRSREGLRVIEDIYRFCFNDGKLAGRLKKIRHEITDTVKNVDVLLFNRDSNRDVGKKFDFSLEGGKKDILGLIIANYRRVEESLRVLEEVSNIIIPKKTAIYKKLRFQVYSLEKSFCEKL